jgi:hypothetical protein
MKYMPNGENCHACAIAIEIEDDLSSTKLNGCLGVTIPRFIRTESKNPNCGLYIYRKTAAAAYVETDRGKITRAARNLRPLNRSFRVAHPDREKQREHRHVDRVQNRAQNRAAQVRVAQRERVVLQAHPFPAARPYHRCSEGSSTTSRWSVDHDRDEHEHDRE